MYKVSTKPLERFSHTIVFPAEECGARPEADTRDYFRGELVPAMAAHYTDDTQGHV